MNGMTRLAVDETKSKALRDSDKDTILDSEWGQSMSSRMFA
jgi:hypothetical protein